MLKYVYELDPIDWFSPYPGHSVPFISFVMQKSLEYLERIARGEVPVVYAGGPEDTIKNVAHQLEALALDELYIHEVFRELKEDFREEPRVLAFPVSGDPEIQRAYIAKADNNGTIYLFTPCELKAYEELKIYERKEDEDNVERT